MSDNLAASQAIEPSPSTTDAFQQLLAPIGVEQPRLSTLQEGIVVQGATVR
jgi:hypothetical protein